MGGDDEPAEEPQRPGRQIAMTLLLPDPRPRMAPVPQQAQHHQGGRSRAAVALCRLGVAKLYAAEVLGADEPVVVGADQPGRRAMVTVERAAIEAVWNEHVL